MAKHALDILFWKEALEWTDLYRPCGDNSCIFGSPGGMATNGGCICSEKALKRGIQWWRNKVKELENK